MATYAIGDIQGCFSHFKNLLSIINFNSHKDRLWLVGDIVNRGPESLKTLKYIKNLGKSVTMVLGNHDIHLIKLAGGNENQKNGDTLSETLASPDIQEIIDWLRKKPLFHYEEDYAMVHAGILPQWDISQTVALANEVEEQLSGNEWRVFLPEVYGDYPNFWNENWTGYTRFRVIINALTRLRTCTSDGKMDFEYKGGLDQIPKQRMAWFDIPGRKTKKINVVFGHWSSIGLHTKNNATCLDTGCVWGRSLSALRLEDQRVFQTDCLNDD